MNFCSKTSLPISPTIDFPGRLFSLLGWSALFVTTVLSISNTYADNASDKDIINEVIVNADFRDVSAQQTAQSITVVSATQLTNRAAQHLQDILNLAPNVNFSAGASRGRFFQIRGIGERSQFKEPIDSSVGLVIDGIDFSNLGLAASLYDIQQVEILRGPQGTGFGSSAMAGLVNIQSAMPTEDFEGRVDMGIGNYGLSTLGVVASGGLNDSLQGRFSIHRNRSDGYITNKFLNRENTNNVDEIGSRVKLRWLASEDTTVDITGIYIDAANGYDAFSLDHSRHTRSDEPGRDYQRSRALSVKATWDQFDSYLLETQVTYEQTELEYGFDWDWSDMATVGVRGFENNVRDRNAHSADLRILSKAGSEVLGGASWVAGIKAYSRKVELSYTEDADYYGAWTGALDSIYRTSRYAVYTQFDWSLTERLALSLGSRLEHFDNDYLDSYGVKGDIADDLLGGKLSLQYQLHDNTMLYGLISSGYKTGGINTDAFGKALVSGDAQTIDLLTQKLTYSDETLLNYELGLKGSYLQDKLQLNLNAFYLDRQNMQAKLALEISSGNWTSYRDNTRGSHSYGVELQSAWQLLPELKLSASLGLLESELGDLVILDIDDIPQSQKGRDQAHAPQYQFNVGIDYQFLDNFSLNIQIDGKDSFYFSNSHNQKSTGYELVHGKLSYQNGPLTVALWGRNLTDQDYQVRGFYFANNPNNGWLAESYTQLGEPRVFGISGQYDF